jgi:hypothetical protein
VLTAGHYRRESATYGKMVGEGWLARHVATCIQSISHQTETVLSRAP